MNSKYKYKKIFLFVVVFTLVSYGFVIVASVHAEVKLGKLANGEEMGQILEAYRDVPMVGSEHYFEPDNDVEGTFSEQNALTVIKR